MLVLHGIPNVLFLHCMHRKAGPAVLHGIAQSDILNGTVAFTGHIGVKSETAISFILKHLALATPA